MKINYEKKMLILGLKLTGLTNREVSKRCGVSLSTVNYLWMDYKNGKMPKDGK